MITIRIINARDVVEKQRNWFVAKVAPYFIDLQNKVEKEIAKEIKKSLEKRNIQAVVSVVKDD